MIRFNRSHCIRLLYKMTGYCCHLVHVISISLSQIDPIKRHPLYLNKLYSKGFLKLNQLTPIIFQQTSSWCRTLRSWSGRRRRCRRRLSNIRFLPHQVFRQDSEKNQIKLLNCDSWSFFIQWKPLNVISLGPRKSDKNYRIQKILIVKALEFS